MKYLQKFNERKNIGDLYHIIDLEKLSFILNTNSLKSYKFSNISTTRNKMMNSYVGDTPTSFIKLQLDGESLSDNYKINPFACSFTEIGSYGSRNRKHFKEYEEVIKTSEIKNIKKYVKKIIIIKHSVERLFDSGWFTSDGGFFPMNDKRRNNIPDIFKELIPKIKELFGDIWIQDGTIIKKDDEWLDSIINYPIEQIHHGYAQYMRGYKDVLKNNRYNVSKDDIIPINKKNKAIEELVIGYNYDDLYLQKENNFKIVDEIIPDYKLYTFNFIYTEENIVKMTNDNVHVKTARLNNIKIIYNYEN